LNSRLLPLLLLLAMPGTASGSDPAPALVPLSAAEAPIALLVDLSSGQTLFARDAEARMLPASMTKAMSALIAFDLIAARRLDEDDAFTVRPATAARWAGKGTTLLLYPNERVAVSDLLRGMTTVSANDAAVVLAEGALGGEAEWLAAMNARAQALGMKDSHFASVNGFPDGGRTYVTARDMVRLAEALIKEHPVLYRRYFGHRAMFWRRQQLTSHDPFAETLPGGDGIKTGFTRQAGFTFLGAVERDGRRLVLVIGKASSEPGRAAAATALAEWGYAAWDDARFLKAGWVVGNAQVQDGALREVPLAVPRAYSLALPAGTTPRVSARIIYRGPIKAPVAKGSVVAELKVTVEGLKAYTLPLVAVRDIDQAGPFDRIVNGLLGLFG
jgi:serine-type D-Ala-D-Ala carboxypeptidase (penicillin-binding protein 5/6)